MTALTDLSLRDVAAKIKAKDVSPVEVTQACLDRAAATEPKLSAFSCLLADSALAEAKAAEAEIAAGNWRGELHGVPVGIKELYDVKGVPTTSSSEVRANWTATSDCASVAQLRDAGTVILGKTHTHEFAYGIVTPKSRNPWGEDHSPGGSSGGSGASVAAGSTFMSMGSDTGGSIRQPAAFTGITGIKPTYGRVSRWGVVAFASSLDQAGPMTKDVRDAAIMLEAMCGHDAKDSTSADLAVPNFEAMLTGDIRGKTIGIPREYRMDGMPEEIEKLWAEGTEMLKAAGAKIVEISLPHTKYALPTYYVIAPAEASSNLARYDGVRYGHRAKLAAGDGITEMYEKTRAEGFGHEVQRRVMVGTYVLSAGFYDAYYNRARKVRTLIKRDFEEVFAAGVDAILTPATPSAAFGLGEMSEADPIAMYLNDVFTVTVNLAGLPGIAVPTGTDSQGLPLGLQLIGRPWEEGDLLNTAYALEQAAGFVAKPAKWW